MGMMRHLQFDFASSVVIRLRAFGVQNIDIIACAGTSCNQRLERITGTEHAKILRVPFRSKAGILRKWISRCAEALFGPPLTLQSASAKWTD